MTGPATVRPTTIDPEAAARAVARLAAATRAALADLVLTMADDEFVSGFTDSEWTGIAPVLEEDVAMSSISQDELGHARALYELLAAIADDGRDADAIAYDRSPAQYRHAALLDRARGDWADTIARRFLYELADEARLASIGDGFAPLAELVAKLRREERYHRMHAVAWLGRLAEGGTEARRRLEAALAALGSDAASVFAPLAGEAELLDAGILSRSLASAEAAWRADLTTILVPLGLALPPQESGAPAVPRIARIGASRMRHGEAFDWLHSQFTMVRRTDPEAIW
ncbi:MAG TPA: 1,2-phenylacetyl-CoA epoxidase subunit PaaC [Candidatus Limnocylindrales bacterium]|nr:1,2-phenylacetyl-CoA epoxidase subunit PaaC [Candidatus Limnocylindrales bacterium]